jgi:phosphopantetheine--protein transferase-like protein
MAVGIDIVNIEHFQHALTSGGQSFLNTHFHPAETVNKTNGHLAGLFAAKEAIMKTDFVKMSDFLAIQILNNIVGKPIPYDAQGNEIPDLEISISHTDTTAIAIAIWNNL